MKNKCIVVGFTFSFFLFILVDIFCDEEYDVKKIYPNISHHVDIRKGLLGSGEKLYFVIGVISSVNHVICFSTNNTRVESTSFVQEDGTTGGTVMIYLPPLVRYDELCMEGLRVFTCSSNKAIEIKSSVRFRVLTDGGRLPSIKPTRRRVLLYAKSFAYPQGYHQIILNDKMPKHDVRYYMTNSMDNAVQDEIVLYILHWPVRELQEGRKEFYGELIKWGLDTNEFNIKGVELPPEDELRPEI